MFFGMARKVRSAESVDSHASVAFQQVVCEARGGECKEVLHLSVPSLILRILLASELSFEDHALSKNKTIWGVTASDEAT